MQEFLFAITLSFSLFMPGACFLGFIKKQLNFSTEMSFLLCVAFSYSCFAILIGVFQIYGLSVPIFKVLYWALLLSSTFSCIYTLTKNSNALNISHVLRSNKEWIVLLAITTLFHLVLGQYDEVPADLYQHLYYFQKANSTYSLVNFELVEIGKWIRQAGLVWYHLIAFGVDVTGVSTSQVVSITALFAKLFFLSGVYFFSKIVFSNSQHVNKIAFITAALVALHMGIAVFSFLRYYSFAPTMVNMVLFYSIVCLSLFYFDNNLSRGRNFLLLLLISLIMVSAAAIHTQEAIFSLIIFACLSFVYGVFPSFKGKPKRLVAKLLAALFFTVFVLSFIYIRNTLDAAPNAQWRLWDFGSTKFAFLPKIMVLNLQNQFIQVVTLWGALVLVVSAFYGRKIIENPFLLAGLLSPLVTILNPFFIDIFLRLYNSTTVWRITYLIPIYFLGAYILVNLFVTVYKNKSIVKTVSAACSILLLLVLLLPLGVSFGGTYFTRYATHAAVNENNSYRHLSDVIEKLDSIKDRKIILTDPITGYVVSGMTNHYSYRRKFFRESYYDFTFETYENRPLLVHKGKLLLVNKRSNSKSKVGKVGNHWPENILDVSNYYPENLLNNLKQNPQNFKFLWQSIDKDILLYQIR